MHVVEETVHAVPGTVGAVLEVVLGLLEQHAALVLQQLLAPLLLVVVLDVGDQVVNVLEAVRVDGGEVCVGAEHVLGEHHPHGGGVHLLGRVVQLLPHLVGLGADVVEAHHALCLPVLVAGVGGLAVPLLEH